MDHGWRMFYLATGEQLNKVAGHATDSLLDFDEPFYAVFPYFKDRHTFAFLHIQSLSSTREHVLPLNPCNHSYCGLHTCLPDTRETHVYNNPMSALLHYSASVQQGHFMVGHVHVASNPASSSNSFVLDHGIFIRTAQTDLDSVIQAKEAISTLQVAEPRADETPGFLKSSSLDWKPYAMAEFVAVASRHGPSSSEFASLVASIKHEPELCRSISRLLADQDCREVLAWFKSRLNASQSFDIGSTHICETRNGYTTRKPGTTVNVPFTNFVLRIDNNVWFEEDPSTRMHCGRVLIRDQEYPIVIPERLVNRPAEIPALAFNAIMQSAGPDLGVYPQILESTHQRKLSDIIRKQAANKPTIKGIKRLGWNDLRNRFVTPTWEVSGNGISATSRIPFVNSEFLRDHYNFSDYSLTDSYELVGKQACYFLAILASGITRAYLHMALPVIYLLRNPASMQLLHALFRPFGQYYPLAFGAQRRSILDILNPSNVSGYPVFGYAIDPDVMYGLNQPVILLSDSGLPYHEFLEKPAFAQTASYSHQILSRIILFCMLNGYQAHKLIQNEDEPKVSEMVCEGKKIIEQACEIENFDIFESDMPYLQSMLSDVPLGQVNNVFRYHMSGKVYIDFQNLNGYAREPLYLELSAKNKEVHQQGSHYLECPANFISDLLNRFFGQPVRLFHQDVKLESFTEEKGGSAQLQS